MMRRDDTLLACIAGYVDTLSVVALFGLLTAHAMGKDFVLMKLMAIPAFLAGVVITSLVASSEAVAPQNAAWRVYAMQAALMLAFCAAGIAAAPIVHPDDTLVIVCGMLGAAAMGVQNARDRLISRQGHVPNTVKAEHVTQIVLDLFELLSPASSSDTKTTSREQLKRTAPAVSSFACGAVGGAIGYANVGFWALLLPVFALLWLTFNASRRQQGVTAPQTLMDGGSQQSRTASPAGR